MVAKATAAVLWSKSSTAKPLFSASSLGESGALNLTIQVSCLELSFYVYLMNYFCPVSVYSIQHFVRPLDASLKDLAHILLFWKFISFFEFFFLFFFGDETDDQLFTQESTPTWPMSWIGSGNTLRTNLS